MEELPRVGSYFTKEIDAAKTSVIVVKGKDEQVRAFYNICRHRGNKLVWNDFPNEEVKGSCRQFTCKYHGWRYDLDGALTFVQQPGEFFDLDNAAVRVEPGALRRLERVHLHQPRSASRARRLREFLGPMITGLDDYPFEKLTERYDFVAHNNSNWKIFADAFQEYYHVPSLHPQQVPSAVRQPNAGFECAHFQLDGPHRVVSTAGTRRWLMDPEYMYPIERVDAQRTGRPVAHARDPSACRTEPRWHRVVGHQQLPDLPEPGDPDLRRLVSAVPVLADVAQHAQVRGVHRIPSRDARVRERIEHEVAAVVLKEFALQDAGMLGGTQAALETGVVDDFPLSDQEILVRHLHKVVVDWVDEYQRQQSPVGV